MQRRTPTKIEAALALLGAIGTGVAIGYLAWGTSNGPYIAVTDSVTCVATDNGGTIHLDGSGFTPGDYYMTLVRQPNNVDWNGYGQPDVSGHTTHWQWPCDASSPVGTYSVVLYNYGSKSFSNTATWEVLAPPKKK